MNCVRHLSASNFVYLVLVFDAHIVSYEDRAVFICLLS